MEVFPAGESISIEEIIDAKNYFYNYIVGFLKVNSIVKNKNILTNPNINTNIFNLFINDTSAEKVKII